MMLPTIHIRDIPEEGLTVDVPLDATWMRHALRDTEIEPVGDPAGQARVRLDKQGRDVILSGSLDARVRMQCVRCLEDVELPLHSDFTLHLEPEPAVPAERQGAELELTAEDLDVDYYEADRIDLGRWVREQILLEAPTYPSCAEPCKHPLESAKTEFPREVDPRLAPLKKLSTKE